MSWRALAWAYGVMACIPFLLIVLGLVIDRAKTRRAFRRAERELRWRRMVLPSSPVHGPRHPRRTTWRRGRLHG